MPLDRLVLLIVVVLLAAMATVWIGALIVSATAVPLGWLAREYFGVSAIFAAELAANIFGGVLGAIVVWRVMRAR